MNVWRFLLQIISLMIIRRLIATESVSPACEYSITDENKLYNYNLAASSKKFPHGVLSEDGYYKVSSNGTVVWFQLCDSMIFNHGPPKCFDCWECGGSSRCGMGCTALVSNVIAEYPVCYTMGHIQTTKTDLIGTSDTGKIRFCSYATQLRHPSGCALIVSANSNGLGWFGILLIIISCLFGGYLIVGAAYRFFYLHIHGIDIIPNLEFWDSLPPRAQSAFMSLVQRLRGRSEGHQTSYSRVDF